MFTCFGCARQNVALVMEWFRDFCPFVNWFAVISDHLKFCQETVEMYEEMHSVQWTSLDLILELNNRLIDKTPFKEGLITLICCHL